MESKFATSINGQAIAREDLDAIASEAASADDMVFAELFRLLPYIDSGTVTKAILPHRIEQRHSDGLANTSALVRPAGNVASLYVYPFRAVVGSRAAGVAATWYDIRSGRYTAANGSSGVVQFEATAANNRWDLLYAKVDINVSATAQQRLVKSSTGTVAAQSLVNFHSVTVTVSNATIVKGTEGAAPTRPSLPADVANTTYYIPLCYVLHTHPFTLSSPIPSEAIAEIAPVAMLASSTGGLNMRPCTGQSELSAVSSGDPHLLEGRPWTIAAGRPTEFLPSTMVGGAMRILALDFGATPKIIASGTAIIDQSMDWRDRLIWFIVYGQNDSGSGSVNDYRFSWDDTVGSPMTAYEPQGRQTNYTGSATNLVRTFVGNTFNSGVPALRLSSDEWSVLDDSILTIELDPETGDLSASVQMGSTPLSQRFVILIIASAQYNNKRVIPT